MRPIRFGAGILLLLMLIWGASAGVLSYTEYSYGTASASDGTPANAFDWSTATTFEILTAAPWYIEMDYGGTTHTINNLTVRSDAANSLAAPNTWGFQGSNDGTSWTTLDNRTGQTGWSGYEIRYYNFTNTNAYRYYQMRIFSSGVAGQITICDLKMVLESESATAPVANFTMSNTTGIDPLIVNFTDTSTNAPIEWNWSFTNVTGDNTQVWFSTAQHPTKVFTTGGNYSIQLNASNTGGSNVTPANTKWVNVTSSATTPIVLWIVNSQTLTFPRYLIGNDTSLNTPTAWCWSFGDGSAIQTTKNVTYQYVKRGIWNASLNVSNAAGYNQSYKLIRILGFLQGAGPGAPLPGVPWQEQASMEYGTYSVSRELSPAERAMTDCKLIGICG